MILPLLLPQTRRMKIENTLFFQVNLSVLIFVVHLKLLRLIHHLLQQRQSLLILLQTAPFHQSRKITSKWMRPSYRFRFSPSTRNVLMPSSIRNQFRPSALVPRSSPVLIVSDTPSNHFLPTTPNRLIEFAVSHPRGGYLQCRIRNLHRLHQQQILQSQCSLLVHWVPLSLLALINY